MIEAQLADGTKLQFPDGTDDAVVDRVVKSHVQSSSSSASSIGSVPQDPAAQRIRGAAEEAFRNAPSQGTRPGNMSVFTPEGQEAINTTFQWAGRNIINPVGTGLGYAIGGLAAAGAAAGATVGELATAAGQPALGRDINIAAQTIPATMDVPAFSGRANIPRPEMPGPRYVAPNAMAPDALRAAEIRQTIRNTLMPPAEEIAPSSSPTPPPSVQQPGYRANVDPTKPFTYDPPSSGWPAGTSTWAEKQPPPSSPTGIPGPMEPPKGYVPPPPPGAASQPTFTGTASSSAEAKQASRQFFKQNAALADKAMPSDFINALSDDLNAAGPKGPLETAVAGENTVGSVAAQVQKLRDTPTTLEDAQRTYSRLGDIATAEFRQNGNSETYHDLMQIQANMRDRIAPPDLAGDDPWTKARKAWSQAMKMETLENMKARADGTKNPQTSFQTQINNMLNNPSRIRGWSDEEKTALRDAGQNGVIGGVLHVVGSRAIPVIAAAIETQHGPYAATIAGLTTYGLGSAAKNAENWLQTRRYDQALRLLGSGVPRNQMMPPP